MGRLIPAGTGLGAYKRLSVHVNAPSDEAGDVPPAPMAAAAGAQAVSAPVEE